MLSFLGPRGVVSRRDVLVLGGLTAGGLSLPRLLKARESVPASDRVAANARGGAKSVILVRLRDRRGLRRRFDTLRRDVDAVGAFAGIDAHTERAVEMISSNRARDAFDLKRETPETIARYGKYCENFLLARRIVEAGIPVVTLKAGDWDTHEHNFRDMREQLPLLDQGPHALTTDLHDRDVAVVVWGEFGRAPRISRGTGRDHWPEAGAAIVAGGGFATGQTIGETDAHGGVAKGRPYTPANVLSTMCRHLGIDPERTLPDHAGRPTHLLDDREPVRELLPATL